MRTNSTRSDRGQLLLLSCIAMIFTLLLLISISVATLNIGKTGGRETSSLQEEYLMVLGVLEDHLEDTADAHYDGAAAVPQDETERVVLLVWEDAVNRVVNLESASGYSLSVPVPDATNISGATSPQTVTAMVYFAGPAGDQIAAPELFVLNLG